MRIRSQQIGKIDVETGECTKWTGTPDQYPSEPIFVPNPLSSAEDDGVLVATVVETREETTNSLIILNAKTMQEVAKIQTEEKIPNGLHGIFISDVNYYWYVEFSGF